ncbi:Alternative oxidase [Dillenia turbinata]|uniref:Ubiquinol oxidase n=1 Tax=Dillenia turbinata TaxID=194707 RepID=A0AAN8ZRE3_9MAGN
MMSNIATKKLTGLLLKQLGPHHLSLISAFGTSITIVTAGNSKPVITGLFRTFILELWNHSTLSLDELMKPVPPSSHSSQGKSEDQEDRKAILSCWGIAPKKLAKEDGTAWRWNCFMKAREPPIAVRDGSAVLGMVGDMLLHCKFLRRFEHSSGWALLEEAENKQMHLVTFIEVAKPKWYDRDLVFAMQGMFFNAYFLTYMADPKLAHHIVGCLEEEAINAYTEFLKGLIIMG